MKILAKRLALAAAIILVSPLIITIKIAPDFLKDELFYSVGTFLSIMPGRFGSYLRLGYYKFTLEQISSDVYIGFGSFFSKRTAQVGDFVSIGAYSIIGNAILGDHVLVSSRVSIMSGKYQHGNSQERNLDETRYNQVRVGNHSWIGENAVVMADVGSGCIVSAGSVVTRAIPDNFIAAGNPARAIKTKKAVDE